MIHYFNMMLCYKLIAKDVLIYEFYNITPIYNPFFVRIFMCVCVCVCERERERERETNKQTKKKQRKGEIRQEFSCLFIYSFSVYRLFLTSRRFETIITNSALLFVSLRIGKKSYRSLIIYYSLHVFNPNVSLCAG